MQRIDLYAHGTFQALVLALIDQFLWPVNLWAFFAGSLLGLILVTWYDTRKSRRDVSERTDAITRRILEARKGKV